MAEAEWVAGGGDGCWRVGQQCLSDLLVLLIDKRHGRRGWDGDISFLSSHRNRASPSYSSSSSMARPRRRAPGLAASRAHKRALGSGDTALLLPPSAPPPSAVAHAKDTANAALSLGAKPASCAHVPSSCVPS